MYHLWRGLPAGIGAAAVWAASAIDQLPDKTSLRKFWTPMLMMKSTSQKKAAEISTMMNTITEVIQVSRREVQVILRASARTSWANWTGLVRFFGGAGAARADAGAIAAAVLEARAFIACGLLPGFLAVGGRLTSM